jgi:hypothetical protein
MITNARVCTAGDPRTNPESFEIAILQVTHEELVKRLNQKPEILSMPTVFATYYDTEHRLGFWPTPDKDYEAIIRFAGPIQEI